MLLHAMIRLFRCLQQGEPTAPLVQRAEPALPALQSRRGEPVRLPVPPAPEAVTSQTHRSDGQVLPVQQAGLELVRSVKGWSLVGDFMHENKSGVQRRSRT